MSSKDKQDLRILSSIESIPSINNILETICIYTDMRLGVLAYVSEQAWIACAVYDNLGIGLKPGQNLQLDLTICSEEAKVTQGNKTITTHFNLTPSVRCDKVRMSQVFSNLISNAIKHSRTDATIHIDAQISNGRFNFNITNESTPIPDSILRNIFKPFVRFKDRHTGGLGLGLLYFQRDRE
ncbi:sensor histidine kinase [Sphingobacterium thalpophilum]|uniref:sensor histidine kinase n=1 Tax=Sphingobacterium thalpophilum TaxID=259 RepID=UPI0024A782D8|nr:ATP-binding protein [Sphingobacterium thalpophilum]